MIVAAESGIWEPHPLSVLADIYLSCDDDEAVVYNIEPAKFADRVQFTSLPEGAQ